MFDCPQCGFETETLNEGYCEECRGINQKALDDHDFQLKRWESLSDNERKSLVNWQL